MAVATYPDNANILARVTEIQELLVANSTASKSPGTSVDHPPFWINGVINIPITPGVRRQSYWEYTIEMALVRETEETAFANDNVTIQIMNDIAAVQKGFRNRANLITPTYTTAPDQYVRDSLNILSNGYQVFPSEEGDMVGSSYTLTFRYMVLQSQAEVDAP